MKLPALRKGLFNQYTIIEVLLSFCMPQVLFDFWNFPPQGVSSPGLINVGPAFRQSMLDRAFTNLPQIDLWPQSRLEFYRGNSSDHATMIISFSSIEKGGTFQINYDSWLSNPKFIELAKEGIVILVCGNGLFRLQQKLRRVKSLIKAWFYELGNSSKQVEEAKNSLDQGLTTG